MPEIYQPTYYFKTCCPKQTLTDNYFGVSNFTISPIPSVDDVFLVKLPSFTGCSSIVTSIPTGSVIYAGENAIVTPYTDCETCIVDYSCWRTPTTPKITYVNVNECGVSTIFPMEVECVITNPTTPISNDGVASISITGGTPPYTVRWGNGNISSSIINLKPGSYPAVVSDYWDDYVIDTTCVLSAQSYNYLLDQCCPSTLYWKLPNGGITDLSEATVGDCEDSETVWRTLRNELLNCYCENLPPEPETSCITDKYSAETQTCGRKTIKYNTFEGEYYWFVQNLDYSFSFYKLEENNPTAGSYNITKYPNCCSESYITGYTNNSVYSSSCGSYTGTGLFDWYNRTVLASGLDNKYLFYPYYNSGTTKCMVSGGSNQEIVTISSDYDVLGKVISIVKTPNPISYTVSSLVDLPPTVNWTPSTIYSICPYDFFITKN